MLAGHCDREESINNQKRSIFLRGTNAFYNLFPISNLFYRILIRIVYNLFKINEL